MSFDTCEHKIRLIVIEFGKALRKAQRLPEENNITILYKEALGAIGVIDIPITSRQTDHLPAPHEMKNDQGNFTIPRRDCPQCGRKDGLSLKSICPSCTDSEGGKYHTMYSCEEMGPDKTMIGCGFKTEKSERFMAQRMSEENPDWEGGMKQELGIKTITDSGVK